MTSSDGLCQRWNQRTPSWRHVSDGGFDAGAYSVTALPERVARDFVVAHHYAASMPAASLCFGLLTDDDLTAEPGLPRLDNGVLVGVAVLSVPMRDRVLTTVFPDLEPYAESLELGRFVLANSVPGNGETWFLARVLRTAAAAGIRGVVSFSDPVPRYRTDPVTGARTQVKPGHVGVIYQAGNAVACGRSTARTQLVVAATGQVLSGRTLTKIRAGESGAAGAERRLVSLGARPRGAGEDPRAWLRDAFDAIGVSRVHHPGMYRYAWPLGVTRTERARVRIALPATGYPKPDLGGVLGG